MKYVLLDKTQRLLQGEKTISSAGEDEGIAYFSITGEY